MLVEQFDSFNNNEHRRLLRDRLGGEPYDGWFAHHIIALQILGEYPELMRFAAEGGFDINAAINGFMLRGEGHVGGHPGYNADIIEAVGEIDLDQAPDGIARELAELVTLYRTAIENNTYGPWY